MTEIKPPPPYFMVESELWQEPGPLKLNWTTRKVAIYLREAASHDPDNVALRSVKRIMANLDLSKYQVESAIKKLRNWPSRRKRFIQSWDKSNNRFVLRPIPPKDQQRGRITSQHTKVYRWFWELSCPDKIKDVFLFICSQFEGKDAVGKELFRCSKFGRKAPSIINCCYIKTKKKDRKGHGERRHEVQQQVVSKVVKALVGTGLMTVVEEASSRSPALVRAYAAEARPALQQRYNIPTDDCLPNRETLVVSESNPPPGGRISEVVKDGLENGQKTSSEASSEWLKTQHKQPRTERIPSLQKRYAAKRALVGPPAGSSRATSEEQVGPPAGPKSGHQRKKVGPPHYQIPFQNPFPEPTTKTRFVEPPLQPQAAAGAIESLKQGEGISPLATSGSQSPESPLTTSLAPLLRDERHHRLVVEVEKMGFFLGESRHDRRHLAKQVTALLQGLPPDLQAADLIDAVQDRTFEGLDRSWGLLLSPKFHYRFADKILDHYGERKSLEEGNKARRLKLLQMANSGDPAVRLQAVQHLRTWYRDSRLAGLFIQYLERADSELEERVAVYREIVAANGSLSSEERARLLPVCKSHLPGVGEESEDLQWAISALTERN